jgi:hypothetical protein
VMQKVPVSLSTSIHVYNYKNASVFAEGTWVRTDLNFSDDTIMNPLQTSKIRCVRSEGSCYQSTAAVSGNLLLAELDSFDIVSWTENSVVFKDSSMCAETIYTIDLKTETVAASGHVTNEDDKFCKSPLSVSSRKTWKLQLSKGFDVYWELRKKARPYLLRVIHSLFGN